VLLSCLPRPSAYIERYGECFDEDGFWGPGSYHLRIMEVPPARLEINLDITKLPTWTSEFCPDPLGLEPCRCMFLGILP